MISKVIASHSGQNENKFPNDRISFKTEICLNWAITNILTHNSLENPVVSGALVQGNDKISPFDGLFLKECML